MSNRATEKPVKKPGLSAREEFGEELLNPGMNAEGRTGAGASPIPPSEAEADAAAGGHGQQAGTARDGIHVTENGDDPEVVRRDLKKRP